MFNFVSKLRIYTVLFVITVQFSNPVLFCLLSFWSSHAWEIVSIQNAWSIMIWHNVRKVVARHKLSFKNMAIMCSFIFVFVHHLRIVYTILFFCYSVPTRSTRKIHIPMIITRCTLFLYFLRSSCKKWTSTRRCLISVMNYVAGSK